MQEVEPKLKNLWCFWDGPPMPPLCELGLKTLLHNSQDFDFHLLNSKNIREYLPDLTENWEKIRKWAHKTDYVKPRILTKYGGVFVDVDVICLNNLSLLTDRLEKSKATFMADELSPGTTKWLSVNLMIAKPNSPTLKRYLRKQYKLLKKTKFKVPSWHAIGAVMLNKSRVSGDVYGLHYQRPCPISEAAAAFLSNKHWSKFIRKKFPAPVIWAICFGSHFKKDAPRHCFQFTPNDWLNSNFMISSAFRYALGMEDLPKITM